MSSVIPTSIQAYSVAGGQIVDQNNQPVQLRGINWFGFETDMKVVHGLWLRNWQAMIQQMKGLGINAVRLPICPETLGGSPVGAINYAINPELQGLNSLEILDRVMAELDRQQMYILLDHHRPNCAAQSELWYTDNYPEKAWIADLVTMVQRYQHLPYLLGLDLKNEPHGKATWGTGDVSTDWNLAAERAAKAILKVAPNALLFVEGIGESEKCSTQEPHWWGGNLEPFACTPLDIPADRLVLSPHVYGPDVHAQPYFDTEDFPDNMPAIWERHFGQFIDQGYVVIIGEFGGRYGHNGDGRDKPWQDALIKYLRSKKVDSGFYWSWNPNSGDTGGLLQDDWQTPWADKLELLQRLWYGKANKPGGRQQSPAAAISPIKHLPTTPAAQLQISRQPISDWGDGYCVNLTATNNSQQNLQWRAQITVEGQIQQSWNAQIRTYGDKTLATGVDWNRQLGPQRSTHFGFCAKRPAKPAPQLKPSAGNHGVTVTTKVQSQWNDGYCTDVTVRNDSPSALQWAIKLDIDGQINKLWNGQWQQTGGQLTVKGKDYNAQLQVGQSTQFGFCADLK